MRAATAKKKAKACSRCGGAGPFAKSKSERDGLQCWCKTCHKKDAAARYKANKPAILARCAAYKAANPEKYKLYDAKVKAKNPTLYMWLKCRNRARAAGIPFTIKVSDIVIPTHCPLLGVALVRGKGQVSRYSPTLDKKIPKLGYVPGNVWVISHKANAMKQDASLEELELLVRNLRKAFRAGKEKHS
jgi:hypothetical protein